MIKEKWLTKVPKRTIASFPDRDKWSKEKNIYRPFLDNASEYEFKMQQIEKYDGECGTPEVKWKTNKKYMSCANKPTHLKQCSCGVTYFLCEVCKIKADKQGMVEGCEW